MQYGLLIQWKQDDGSWGDEPNWTGWTEPEAKVTLTFAGREVESQRTDLGRLSHTCRDLAMKLEELERARQKLRSTFGEETNQVV